MVDLKELRKRGALLLSDPPQPDVVLQAADEIERLRIKCEAQKMAFISFTQWDDSPLPVEFEDEDKGGWE